MKHKINILKMMRAPLALFSFLLLGMMAFAQDEPATEEKAAIKPVRNTFESVWLIDNQSVMVPIKGTFEMDIMHRFGTLEKGYEDFYGFFAPSNIRLGFSYVPIENLNVGVAITKTNMTWEAYAKYAILKQSRGNEIPVSVTWFSDMAYETRLKEYYINSTDRLSYFHQVIIARKVTDWLSVQVAPSLTHMNFVYGQFVDTTVEKDGKVQERKHDHFALAVSGRVKIKEGMGIILNYDQPITKHKTGNPYPNLSLGLELTTSSHTFQVFAGNYYYITPQRNNYFNQNDYRNRQFLIGFNITRLWNY